MSELPAEMSIGWTLCKLVMVESSWARSLLTRSRSTAGFGYMRSCSSSEWTGEVSQTELVGLGSGWARRLACSNCSASWDGASTVGVGYTSTDSATDTGESGPVEMVGVVVGPSGSREVLGVALELEAGSAGGRGKAGWVG